MTIVVPRRSRWATALLDGLTAAASSEPGAPPEPALRDLAATLRLDGSPVDEARLAALLVDPSRPRTGVAEAALAGARDGATPPAAHTWLDAMGNLLGDDAPDDAVIARELAGLLDAWTDDRGLAAAPSPAALHAALVALHDALTPGLVASADSGVLRTSAQAIHDASTSRILFYPPDASSLPARLEALLTAWAADLVEAPAVERAALVHHGLALLHPFESANGRLARTVARHLLVAGGLDPTGMEAAMSRDPIAYWEQLVADERRGADARTVEVFAEHLLVARSRTRPTGPPPAWVEELADAFTVAEARTAVGAGLDDTLVLLVELAQDGHVRAVAGTQGLRWRRGDAG